MLRHEHQRILHKHRQHVREVQCKREQRQQKQQWKQQQQSLCSCISFWQRERGLSCRWHSWQGGQVSSAVVAIATQGRQWGQWWVWGRMAEGPWQVSCQRSCCTLPACLCPLQPPTAPLPMLLGCRHEPLRPAEITVVERLLMLPHPGRAMQTALRDAGACLGSRQSIERDDLLRMLGRQWGVKPWLACNKT